MTSLFLRGLFSSLLAACFLCVSLSTQARGSAVNPVYEQLLKRYGRAIVTVNYVISFDGAGAESRVKGETDATLVSADGLLVVPSSVLNPADMYAKVYRSQAQKAPNMRSSEIKVRLPGSDQPLEAEVVTQDRDLGLAWLKIKNPPANLQFVDLTTAVDPVVGQMVYAIGLISEEFDYAPFVQETRVQGRIEVPYKAFVVDQAGAVMFNEKGKAVGFAVLQIDGTSNLSAGGNYRMFATLVGGERLQQLQAKVRALADKKS